jgi:ABC-type sugar transport system permease subunit
MIRAGAAVRPLLDRGAPSWGPSARGRNADGAAYVAPAMLLIVSCLYLPSVYAFFYSLFDIRLLGTTHFVGLANYVFLGGDPELLAIIGRSAGFTACAVVLAIATALGVALWIHTLGRFAAMLCQILVVVPWVISPIVGALLFRWVFVNQIGLGLYALQRLGLRGFDPLSSPFSGMAVLIAFACWRTVGFATILLLAGLKGIPKDFYEAASVDGASALQKLWSITLPQLRTPMLITLVILTLSNLNTVEAPLVVTGGGPNLATDILPLDLYQRAFAQYDFNSAVAMGVGMFAANIALALIYVRLVGRNA